LFPKFSSKLKCSGKLKNWNYVELIREVFHFWREINGLFWQRRSASNQFERLSSRVASRNDSTHMQVKDGEHDTDVTKANINASELTTCEEESWTTKVEEAETLDGK